MGNAQIKAHSRVRNKKQVHWKAADRSAPPGKPELLPETEGTPDLVTLRWSRPVSDGGSPISGYLVEHRRVGSPHWVRATPLPVPFPEITLSGLEPGWRYQFRVSAENAVGYSEPSEVSEPITVTLQRSAVTAPKFTQEVNETVALENDKCEFVVHFLGQPAPRVCWFKDGFEIFSSRRIRILTEYDRSVLTIHQTSLSDEGEIKCTATNKAGHISSKARLTVEAPPSIRLPRNYEDGLLFEMGEVIRLKVSVVGRPIPLVLWSHNGESLQNTDRYEIDFADKSFSLKIADARRSDRGEYQIKAVNKLGEDTASFLVTVTDKPSPPVPSVPGKAKVVMTLGRSVTLSWTTPEDDGGCKIGNYIVEYYRLGWNVWLKAATSRQLSTRLGDLIEGSQYKFRIKAESPYGVSDPSEESEVIFIPDPKRGLTHPPVKGRNQPKDFFEEPASPTASRRKNKSRSHSSSRVETLPPNNVEQNIPPIRPKRTKSKSQQQTPESSPIPLRKETFSQMNKNIFDRSSLARDLAYGSPDLKLPKEAKRNSISNSPENHIEPSRTQHKESNGDHAVYKVKIEPPKEELRPIVVETRKTPSPEVKKKLIREHSATISGSSEFMLVLYSDENQQDQSDIFNFEDNAVPPPLSLSAPELAGLDQPLFPALKNSASSTELLHERAMMRFYQAAEAEEKELEKAKAIISDRRPSYDIPKIQINSKESDDIVGLDRRHSLRRKMSAGVVGQQQSKWAQKRHSLKNASDFKVEIPSNLKKVPLSSDMKRELMMLSGQSTSEELTDHEFERTKTSKKPYTQASFARKPVTNTEEEKWKEEYEESVSESESDSGSDFERFKYEVSRSRKVHLDEGFDEEGTYRPPGGLSGMTRKSSEPFEILNKRKDLPDPNFVPKPILKKSDSPSVSPTISPTVSPPSSPTKVPRALSPRPDFILQRNRSKSLAVPVLPPLISSSGDESDEPKIPKNRSFSLTSERSPLLPKKQVPKISNKVSSTVPLTSISAVATISGITAASIVIPKNLLNKKNSEEEARVVADHYDHIVRSVGQRRRSNPFLDRDELKRAAENMDTPQEGDLSSKEQTPSKENLSQDSGYQGFSGYRRSSFTDHYDSLPASRSPVRQPIEEVKPLDQKGVTDTPIKHDIGQEKSFTTVKVMESNFGAQTRGISDLMHHTKDIAETSNKKIISPIKASESGVKPNEFNNPVHSQRATQISNSQKQESKRGPSVTKGKRSVSRSKSPSKRDTSVSRRAVGISPVRAENWDSRTAPRKVSPLRKSKSPSPSPMLKRRPPMLKEITTQTSGYLDSFDVPSSSKTSTPEEEWLDRAEVKIKSAVDWVIDFAMLGVACWLYLFRNELLVIPILLVMIYRQLNEEKRKIVKRAARTIAAWIVKMLQKKKAE